MNGSNSTPSVFISQELTSSQNKTNDFGFNGQMIQFPIIIIFFVYKIYVPKKEKFCFFF